MKTLLALALLLISSLTFSQEQTTEATITTETDAAPWSTVMTFDYILAGRSQFGAYLNFQANDQNKFQIHQSIAQIGTNVFPSNTTIEHNYTFWKNDEWDMSLNQELSVANARKTPYFAGTVAIERNFFQNRLFVSYRPEAQVPFTGPVRTPAWSHSVRGVFAQEAWYLLTEVRSPMAFFIPDLGMKFGHALSSEFQASVSSSTNFQGPFDWGVGIEYGTVL